MKLNVLGRLMCLSILTLLLFYSANAQVTKSSFNFGKPDIINVKKIAEYEKNHPVILKPRFIEQGEDRDKFILKPGAVDRNAKVQQVTITKMQAQAAVNSPAPVKNFQGVLDNGTLIPPD